ncbi:MAG: hypothetical protein JO157_14845, partial [Acetobacteraceae bacterium]|nr:hypothetical protein [Acetobacteraceae bacterium]
MQTAAIRVTGLARSPVVRRRLKARAQSSLREDSLRKSSSRARLLPPERRPAPPSEAVQLIRRIAGDADREAFGQLFALFGPRVKSYLLRHGAAPQQAEDLAQETLIVVWRKAAYYDPARASPAAWIYTIARNL